MTTVHSPLMRYHGAKWRLAPWIIMHFPPPMAYETYVEPFGGSAAVLLRKPRSYAEVYNDLDAEIVNLFRVLRDHDLREQLIEAVSLTPYARDEFTEAYEPHDTPLERARATLIRAYMGFGSAGATQGITGFRLDTRRSYGTAQHQWARLPSIIDSIADRFSGVLIEHRDAVEVMQQHDTLHSLHYVDPPYVSSSRATRNKRTYSHELDDDQHIRLLETLKSLSGYVLLSGYDNAIYQDALRNWVCIRKTAAISGQSGTAIRTECLWLNPRAAEWAGQLELSFGEAANEQ